MSADQFIAGLEERGLLSERLMSRLRAKLAGSKRPLTADAIAQFLVEKQHLTPQQAAEVLGGLVSGQAAADPSDAEQTTEPPAADEATPILSPSSAVISDAAPQIRADQAEGDYEGSSIFEPFPAPSPEEPAEPEEELRLAPGSDLQSEEADRPAATARVEDRPAVALPELGESFDKSPPAQRDRRPPRERTLLDEPFDSPPAEVPPALESKSKRRPKKPKKKPDKRINEWDSPLILLGGGALAVLLLGGLTIAWLLNTESADEVLSRAQKAVDTGSYTQAIHEYQQFLEKFPRHRDRSVARVKLALTQLRKAAEASNYAVALDVARSELEAIEKEENFAELAHPELAALLPRIALGLAREAEAARDPQTAKNLVADATAALALTLNTKYVPKSFRDETQLDEVRQSLGQIERRQQSQQDLQRAIADMEKSISAGDTTAAYAGYREFTRRHPDLAGDAGLEQVLGKTTAAERAAIRFVAEKQAAETTERPTPWIASLAVAHRRLKPSGSPAAEAGQAATDAAICLRIDGAVYGLQAATGRLLWRRHVGYSRAAWPITADDRALIADTRHHEWLCLDSATGRLLWRQAIGEPFAQPLVVGKRGFLPAESGRLYVVDIQSGDRQGYVQFAQPLRVTPAVDRNATRLYLTGDHSSLYAISFDDLSCLGVYFLGHAEGSVSVSPVVMANKLAVVENFGRETSRLRLMSLQDDGTLGGQIVEKRLTGLATSPPFVAGRRLIVTTDRGQIDVYEAGPGNGEDALALVATRAAAGSKPLVRHAALAGNSIWVGDNRLTRYSILPTGNRLPVEAIDNDFEGATFDHPLALVGKTLIHAHRPKGRAGFVAAASDTTQGIAIWETDLAMPPAAAPLVDEANKTLVFATADGLVFRFGEAAMRSRVHDEPLAANAAPATLPPLSSGADLGRGRAAFAAPDSDRLLLYNPAPPAGSAQWIHLDSPLACAVTPLADGFVAPLRVGQVFYLSAETGQPLATPFQPVLEPGAAYDYQPAAPASDPRQFVITDGREKIYLVGLVDQPQPHLKALAEAKAPAPIESPLAVLGDAAIAVAGSSQLVRYRLPSLEPAGEASLPAPVTWGPFPAGDNLLLITADEQLIAISAAGDVAWQHHVEHGDLAGPPLVHGDSATLAYRSGIVERRSLADGKPAAAMDVGHPLAAGPVQFMKHLVLTAGDGTLLVVDQP
jgi:hypothetical protein